MSQLQKPREFLEDLISRIETARSFVGLQAMVFESGHALALIEPYLEEAVKRGVKVEINMDWVSRRYAYGDLDLFPSLSRMKRIQDATIQKENRKAIIRLKRHGVVIREMNRPNLLSFVFPVFRRNHTKLYVVDDCVWMGGVNFFDKAFNYVDLMVRFEEEKVVSLLKEHFYHVNEKQLPHNSRFEVDEESTFLVDAGEIGRSIIYDGALEMIDSAKKSIIFFSQLVPEGKIQAALLKKAQEGVKVTILTSSEDDLTFKRQPHKWFYRKFISAIAGLANITVRYYRSKVHAKVIVVDDQEIIFGSHNFVDEGVLMGTEEIAMRSRDKDLVSQCLKFIDEYFPNT